MARIAKRTISGFEKDNRQPHPLTIEAIRAALEGAGVEFIPDEGAGPGVRLKRAV